MKAEMVALIQQGHKEAVFGFIDKEFVQYFGLGQKGIDLYMDLAGVFQLAQDDAALKAYQGRYVDLIDKKLMGKQLLSLFMETIDEGAERREQAPPPKKTFFRRLWENYILKITSRSP